MAKIIHREISNDEQKSIVFLQSIHESQLKHIINDTPCLASAVIATSIKILRKTNHPQRGIAVDLFLESALQNERQYLNLTPYTEIVTNANLKLFISWLKENSELRVLSLHGCIKISKAAEELSKLTNLASLNLGECTWITDKEIKKLQTMTKLQELRLSQNYNITEEALNFPNLTSLTFYSSKNVITDKGLELISQMTSLRKLILGNCEEVSNTGLLHLTKLKELSILSMNTLVSIDDEGLSGILAFTKLSKLILRRCVHATDKSLLKFTKLKNLRSLELSVYKHMTGKGLEAIGKLTNLKHLNLNFCSNIKSKGLISLSTLTQLVVLSLKASNAISAEVFQTYTKMTNLRVLDLSYCDVDDSCLKFIGEMFSLRNLNLYWCKEITEAGISNLSKLPHLRILDIGYCDKIRKINLPQKNLKLKTVKLV